MKYLKTFELKTGIVNFSNLGDNWSAEFHLDDDINYYKKEFKLKGRKVTIKKIVNNIKKIGKDNYNSIKKDAQKRFYVNLPAYENAIEESYWTGNYGRQSIMIIALSALYLGVKKQKEKIQKDINELKNKLQMLDDLEI